jgi:hypothetical protein
MQQRWIEQWCLEMFGKESTLDVTYRGLRFAEESIEAAQAAGVTEDVLHNLVSFIFSRPVGELGGCGVALMALATAAGVSQEECELTEVSRLASKPKAYWEERAAAKAAAGFGRQTAGTKKELYYGIIGVHTNTMIGKCHGVDSALNALKEDDCFLVLITKEQFEDDEYFPNAPASGVWEHKVYLTNYPHEEGTTTTKN